MKNFILIAFITLLFTDKCGAQALAFNGIAPAVNFSSATARPLTADRPMHGYSARKERVANRLLITGGACLVVGVPLLVYGLTAVSRLHADDDHNVTPFATASLGVVLTATGIGLTIPGSILKLRNHKHRQAATY